MLKNSRVVLIAASLLAGSWAGIAGPRLPGGPEVIVSPAQTEMSTGAPKGTASSKQKRVAAGEDYTRQLLALMDTDKNGKVSKQEFMNFMEKEFDRLDANHDGELDVNELTRIRVRPNLGK